jgi:hypothetical protein
MFRALSNVSPALHNVAEEPGEDVFLGAQDSAWLIQPPCSLGYSHYSQRCPLWGSSRPPPDTLVPLTKRKFLRVCNSVWTPLGFPLDPSAVWGVLLLHYCQALELRSYELSNGRRCRVGRFLGLRTASGRLRKVYLYLRFGGPESYLLLQPKRPPSQSVWISFHRRRDPGVSGSCLYHHEASHSFWSRLCTAVHCCSGSNMVGLQGYLNRRVPD